MLSPCLRPRSAVRRRWSLLRLLRSSSLSLARRRPAPATDSLALPRVVPPPLASTPKLPITPVPVTTAAPKPAVDLLTAPTVPPAWLTAPGRSASGQLAVIPSGLPGWPRPASAARVHAALPPKFVPPPVVAVPVTPALTPLTVANVVRPTTQPLAKTWPPAHLVRKNTGDQETRGVAYFETAPLPQTPAAVVAIPAAPK